MLREGLVLHTVTYVAGSCLVYWLPLVMLHSYDDHMIMDLFFKPAYLSWIM